MRIVIFTQCIIPYISPRSQRSWNLALNLAKKGHEVTLYAILGNASYAEYESKYPIKVKELGPSVFGCIRSDGKRQPVLTRALIKIAGKYTQFPYFELIGLVKRSLKREMDTAPIDLLITIASPHAIHWGAAKVLPSKRVKCWVADCGDPFMGNPFTQPPCFYERIERDWCNKVDAISIPVEEGRAAYYPEYREKIRVIPQGFDFSNINLANYHKNDIPTFAFSGAIYKLRRDPTAFLEFLIAYGSPFKFVVYTIAPNEYEPYASLLGDKIEFRHYVPREQLVFELSKMDFLINIKNESGVQQPSKLIDYAQAQRPILEISSRFSVQEREHFVEFLGEDYHNAYEIPDLSVFDINNVCCQFLDIVKEV